MLDESQCRAFFGDVECSKCKQPASFHSLHESTWHNGDTCVWTWMGVIKNTLEATRPVPCPGEDYRDCGPQVIKGWE